MPNSNQTTIDRVRSGAGTTAMEYIEYQVDVLALCDFAEQAQADLASVTAERNELAATVADLRSEPTFDELATLRARVAELDSELGRIKTLGVHDGDSHAESATPAKHPDTVRVDFIASYWKSQHTGWQALLGGNFIENPTGSFRDAIDWANPAKEARHD